jgi:hypothetical protein
MIKLLFSIALMLLFVQQMSAQTDTTKLSEDELLLQELGANDIKQSLLPEGMGLIRRSMWGEKGLMRKFSFFELTQEKRDREILLRRRMLQTHQALGFVALGGMIGSCITGQIMINTKSGATQERVKPLHDAAITTTMIAYGTTALLQLLAPPPIIIRKNKGWSNMKAHRTLAYLHFSGMVLTPIAGQMMYGDYSLQNGNSEKLRHFHQVSGYVTTALFAGAIIVMKF